MSDKILLAERWDEGIRIFWHIHLKRRIYEAIPQKELRERDVSLQNMVDDNHL